jgi:xylan 1,4-beta-xylosidase
MVDGSHATVSAWIARSDSGNATVLLTNHALPHHRIKKERVQIKLTDAPRPARAYIERVDETHANAIRAWREMKKPEYLDRKQFKQLQAASELVKETVSVTDEGHVLALEVNLIPHAVAAVTIEFEPEQIGAVKSGARPAK